MDISNIVKLPYANWESIRQIGSDLENQDTAVKNRWELLTIARKVNVTADMIEQFDSNNVLSFVDARRYATIRFAKRVNELYPKRPLWNVENETGMGVTLTCKLMATVDDAKDLSDVRPFSTRSNLLPLVAKRIMGTSCHHMLFGENCRIVLPAIYSLIAKIFEQTTDSEKESLLVFGRNMQKINFAEYKRENPNFNECESRINQLRSSQELLAERLSELENEIDLMNKRNYLFISTESDLIQLKALRKKISDAAEEQATGAKNLYEPAYEALMFYALESGQAIDFFVTNDYITGSQNPIYRQDTNGLEEVTDRKTLEFLSYCVSTGKEYKANLLGRALSYAMIYEAKH